MRPRVFPLTGSAILICYRLWTTVKELTWLEGYAMIMSTVAFVYKKRKSFLHYLQKLWSSLDAVKSETADDGNPPEPNIQSRNRRKRRKNSPGVTNDENSTETVDRVAVTCEDPNESDKKFPTTCIECNNTIEINNLSDVPHMPGCYHSFCRNCFVPYFSDMISQLDVTMWLCPRCGDSSITDYPTYLKDFAEILRRFMGKAMFESAKEKMDKWFKYQESQISGLGQSGTLYECEMCSRKVTESELVGMPSCRHRFCTICTTDYFRLEIEFRDLEACYCPFCVKDETKEQLFAYFTKLGEILQPHLFPDTFQIFERKLEEFRYQDMCIKCHSPIKGPDKWSKTVLCRYCNTTACPECRLLWDPAHYRMQCEAYEDWINKLPSNADNMSKQPIDCVSCGERFLNIRDGTLLFTCPSCQTQMCRSCRRPFYLGEECPDGKEKCCLLFFHAHHLENCLFYLQHKEVNVLFMLLEEQGLAPKVTSEVSLNCNVQVKKNFLGKITYGKCRQKLYDDYLGLCKNHAVDFLSTIIVKNSVNTAHLFDDCDWRTFTQRSLNDFDQIQIECGTECSEGNEQQLQIPHSSWDQTDTSSPPVTPSSDKTPRPMEIVPEVSGTTESNVLTQPDIKSPEAATTCKTNEEEGESPPENVCPGCKLDSQISRRNIFGCEHHFCTDCIQIHFFKFIKFESPQYLSCPECHRPNIKENKIFGRAYLAALSMSLEKILNVNHFEIFTNMLENCVTSLKLSGEGSDIRNVILENGGEINPGSSSDDLTEAGIDASEMVVD